MRPLLLSAVSPSSSNFTAVVNNAMSDIISAMNGSNINLTVTFYEYIKVVVFYHFSEAINHSSIDANISDTLNECLGQAAETSSVAELVELFHNISTAIKILIQVTAHVLMYKQTYVPCMYTLEINNICS